jgi:hypothetical protein
MRMEYTDFEIPGDPLYKIISVMCSAFHVAFCISWSRCKFSATQWVSGQMVNSSSSTFNHWCSNIKDSFLKVTEISMILGKYFIVNITCQTGKDT